MDNLISYNIIEEIYEENSGKLKIPDDKNGIYTLNKENIERVKLRVNEQEIGADKLYKTQHDKNMVLLFLDFLKNNIRYVPFTEYYTRIQLISNEILSLITNPKFDIVFFVSSGSIEKSNFWVMLLVISCINTDIPPDIKKKIIISSDIYNIYKLLLSYKQQNGTLGSDTNILIIYYDDMSYTGTQIYSNIPSLSEIPENINIEIYLGIGYISDNASSKLLNIFRHKQNVKMLQLENTEIIKSTKEQLVEWIKSIGNDIYIYFPTAKIDDITNIDPIFIENLVNIINMIMCDYVDIILLEGELKIKQIKQINQRVNQLNIHNSQKKILLELIDSNFNNRDIYIYRGIDCSEGKIPIYFDHKLADGLSTFQKFLRLGTYPSNEKCEYTSLIDNCEPDIGKNLQKINYCKDELGDISKNDSCPQTYYKTVQYTMDGKILDKDSVIEEAIKQLFSQNGGKLGLIKSKYKYKISKKTNKLKKTKNTRKYKK